MLNRKVVDLFNRKYSTMRSLENHIDCFVYPNIDMEVEERVRRHFCICKDETVLYIQEFDERLDEVPCDTLCFVITDVGVRYNFFLDPMATEMFAFKKGLNFIYDKNSKNIFLKDVASEVNEQKSFWLGLALNSSDDVRLDVWGDFFSDLFSQMSDVIEVEANSQVLLKNFVKDQQYRENNSYWKSLNERKGIAKREYDKISNEYFRQIFVLIGTIALCFSFPFVGIPLIFFVYPKFKEAKRKDEEHELELKNLEKECVIEKKRLENEKWTDYYKRRCRLVAERIEEFNKINQVCEEKEEKFDLLNAAEGFMKGFKFGVDVINFFS